MKKFKLVLSCLFLTFFCTNSLATVPTCGYYKQPYCVYAECKGNDNCLPTKHCNAGLVVNEEKCTIPSMTNWETYPINTIRGTIRVGDINMNAWKYDDLVRDKLNMDSTRLGAIVLNVGTQLNDGRYIYVLRANDANMVVRSFDRDEEVDELGIKIRFQYSRYRSFNNYRVSNTNDSNGFADSFENCSLTDLRTDGKYCVYKHVRHSQLNGTKPSSGTGADRYNNSDAWNPVYCAGELRVFNGRIDRINTNSGHFKPGAECINNVKTLLNALNIPISANLQTSQNISTAELYNCGSPEYSITTTQRAPICLYSPSFNTWNSWIQRDLLPAELSCYVIDQSKYWRHGRCVGPS